MKKLITFLIVIISIILISLLIMWFMPNLTRTCKLENYNITIEIPYSYAVYDESVEGALLSVYDSKKGISINVVEVNEKFWSSGDINVRMDEYLNLISAMNYDTSIKNPSTEIIEKFEGKIGKVEVELEGYENTGKAITVITNDTVGNIIIEITGEKEKIQNNIKEIDKIIESLTI